MTPIAREVRVTGRVQGVWFRGWTQETALARGLSGWVRNEADGSVRALLAGPEPAVRGMLRALEEGPPAARVRDLEVSEAALPDRLSGFEIRR